MFTGSIPVYILNMAIYVLLQFLQSLAGPFFPSEIVAASATFRGMDLASIVMLGTIGITAGDWVNFTIAKRIRTTVLQRSKWRLVRRLEGWCRRRGILVLIIISVLPIGLSDMVSYFAGLGNLRARVFITLTLLGTVARLLLVSLFLTFLIV